MILILFVFSILYADASCNFCSNCLKIILLFCCFSSQFYYFHTLQEFLACIARSLHSGRRSFFIIWWKHSKRNKWKFDASEYMPRYFKTCLRVIFLPLLFNLGVLYVNDQTSNPNFKPTITVGVPLALTVMMGTCGAPFSHGAESISFLRLN